MHPPVQQYLVTEALRHLEEAAGEPQRDPAAENAAIAAGLSFSERIYARAQRLAGQGIGAAVRRTGDRLRLITLIFAALCLLIGIGATHALPQGYPAQANVVSLLALLLLPNTVSLMLWLSLSTAGLFIRGHDLNNSWLGRWVLGLHTFLERLAHAGRYTRAASRAWREFMTTTACGRFRLTILAHSLWLSMLFGALAGCWWLMVIRQVDFVWGTTLLTTNSVQGLFGHLTHWVGSFGFSVPNAADIAASRIDAQLHDALLRRHWGIFILGAIITLAMLPRLVAIILDGIGLWRAGRKLTLNLAQPGYARLRPVLMPVSASRGIIGGESIPDGAVAGPTGIILSPDIPPRAAWLALEYPPEQPFTACAADLGVVAAYDEQQRVAESLSRPDPGWPAVNIYADLAITPDTGIVRCLTTLAAASSQPVHLVLGLTTRARALPESDLKLRREDWLQAAAQAGLQTDRIHVYER